MNISVPRKLSRHGSGGFTLVEVLVVIGILAILLAITLIAINPNKHFQDTRNTQRRSDVSAVLDAVYEYEAANSGNVPATLTNLTLTMPIGKATTTAATGTAFATPNLTFTVPAGNTITSGTILVDSCSQAADNGTFAVGSGTGTTIVVSNATASAISATGCIISTAVNVCPDLAPTYVADLPMDPSKGTSTGGATPCNGSTTAYSTGYTITKANGRFTVAAPNAESATISVTR